MPLNTGTKDIPDKMGIYIIRKKNNKKIIYIGESTNINKRIGFLLNALKESDKKKAKNIHSASVKIKKYNIDALELSWFECNNSKGVEKALLLAFHVSHKQLPECNTQF